MKIILTGASGFLGKHIAGYFAKEELITLGRTAGQLIVELEKTVPDLPVADLVIHAAGKAHMVPKTETEAKEFYEVNVKGTQNLLDALDRNVKLPGAFVFISTVAVYGLDTGIMITEDAPLAATDPYGKSKIIAEQLVQEWCGQHHIPYAILRLPLVAGPNPPGNLKSMINGIKKGYYFNIAGGKARKSMVLAAAVPAAILPAVAAGGIFNLTDGDHPSFAELSGCIAVQLERKKPMGIPRALAGGLSVIGSFIGKRSPLNKKNYKKMINDLTFDDSRARKKFGWNPLKVINEFKI